MRRLPWDSANQKRWRVGSIENMSCQREEAVKLRAAAGVIERPRPAIVVCQMETVAAVRTEGLVLYSDSLSDTSRAGEEG